jgi:hypothetical protein
MGKGSRPVVRPFLPTQPTGRGFKASRTGRRKVRDFVARGAARDLRTALLCTVVVLGFFALLLYHRAFNGIFPTAD